MSAYDGDPKIHNFYKCLGAGMILSLESSVAEDLRDKFKQFFIRTIIGKDGS